MKPCVLNTLNKLIIIITKELKGVHVGLNDKSGKEYNGIQEWIGEEWCIVCGKMHYEHYPEEIDKCVQKVKDGYRLA